MRKSFVCHLFKKIALVSFYSLFLFITLFAYVNNVKASSSFNFDSYYNNFDTQYPIFLLNKETILNTISNEYWDYNQHSIANLPNTYDFGVYNCPSDGSYTFSFAGLGYSSCYRFSFNTTFTSVTYKGTATLNLAPATVYGTYYSYIYTDYNYVARLSGSGYDSIVIPSFTSSVYNVTIPEIVLHEGDTIPTYDDIYNTYINVPEPADDYPLLTQFYTLFLNKLSFFCEYIYSDYIILSIFVILLFYSIILLFRRLN